MNALALVVLGRLRTQWRSLAALALLTGIGLGLFSGAIGIAMRTDSSPARIASAAESPHVEWSNVSFEDLAAFRRSGDERVAAVRQWVGFLDVSGGPVSHADFVGPVDADVGVERPVVRVGHEPVAVDEILLNEMLAEQSGLGVGDSVSVALLGSDFESIEPFEFVVVGIGTVATEHGFVDDTNVTPLGIVSRAFAETHPDQVAWSGGGAMLPDGPISRADASERFADLEWPITIIGLERQERARSALRPTVGSLVILGGLGLLATMMVAGFALLRALEVWQRDREVLRAIGLARRTIRRVDIAITTIVLGVATGIGLVVNIALSPLGPVGPLRLYEPDRGARIDVVSIGALGLATIVIGALSLLLLFARSSTSASPRAGFSSDVSLALLSGSTRSSRRTLVLSTVLAIIAVAAAAGSLPYLMSLDALVENADRYGQPWDATARNRFGDQSAASIRNIAEDPEVEGVATLAIGSVIIDGVANVTAAGYEVVSGDDLLVVTSGRRATRPDEVVMGSATRADFGFELGDEITMSAIATLSGADTDSPSSPVTATIVGDALFPAVNSAGAGAPRLNSGLMMSRAMWDELTGATDLPEVTLVSVAPGVDVQSVIDRHPDIEDLGASGSSTEWFTDNRPAEIRSADDARRWMLAGLASLIVLVAGILSISLRVLVMGQHHDIAVLRALGASRRRVRRVIAREGVILLAPTLLIGVPIGIGCGRLLYSRLASDIGVLTAPTTPLWASAAFVATLATLSLSGMLLATRAALEGSASEDIAGELMPAEVAAALGGGALWAVAGAASTARPRLQLGRFFQPVCWVLAAISSVGGLVAWAVDRTWPATVFVWVASSLAVTIHVQTSRRRVASASAEGRAALGLLGVGLIGVVALTLSVALSRSALGWPDRIGLIGTCGLVLLALLTVAVQFAGVHRWGSTPPWLLSGIFLVLVSSSVSVTVVDMLIGDLTGDRIGLGEAFAAACLASALVALVHGPTVRGLNRRLQADRPDATQALVRLDGLVQRRVGLDEILLQAAELMRTSLGLDRCEVWTVTEHELCLTASDPYVAPRAVPLDETAKRVAGGSADKAHGSWLQTWLPGLVESERPEVNAAAVSYAGELRGVLVAYGAADADLASELLDQVAHRLGPALHSASLDASLSASVVELRERERDLRASRERLVAAADSERSRIERNLHDGAQQHLVALGVNLHLAYGLVRSDPSRAEEIIGELSVVARNAAQELRSLSHGIFPQSLEDGGIGAALDELSLRQGNVDIQVASTGVGRVAPEIEAAVYFVCSEAITNAVKHGDPRRIRVNIVAESSTLVFEVIDDGTGFDHDPTHASHGLMNMADRLGAVDGSLNVTSSADGTRVLGTVPLTSDGGSTRSAAR